VFVAASLITFIESKTNSSVGAMQILFEVVSAFGTVGLSMGVTAKLAAMSQIVIVATMYIGRVGIILLMAAIIGDPKPSMIQYSKENLLIG
ncbi:MAG: potassium transporter TrkG, partial [Pseudanabaena sp. ELA748]